MNKLTPVYYSDIGKNFTPVKDFLENKYLPLNIDNDNIQNKKTDAYAHIDDVISHLVDNGGIPSCSKYASVLRDYPFHKMDIKDKLDRDTLIRLPYFVYDKEILVLLSIFEKPDNYDRRRWDGYLKKEYEKAKEYYNNFLKNPKNYENYP